MCLRARTMPCTVLAGENWITSTSNEMIPGCSASCCSDSLSSPLLCTRTGARIALEKRCSAVQQLRRAITFIFTWKRLTFLFRSVDSGLRLCCCCCWQAGIGVTGGWKLVNRFPVSFPTQGPVFVVYAVYI